MRRIEVLFVDCTYAKSVVTNHLWLFPIWIVPIYLSHIFVVIFLFTFFLRFDLTSTLTTHFPHYFFTFLKNYINMILGQLI